MELLTTLTVDACRSLTGFEVADRSRQPVGTLRSLWAAEGLDRGLLVPAQGVQVEPGAKGSPLKKPAKGGRSSASNWVPQGEPSGRPAGASPRA
jgi:hypothetical protein